MITAMTTKGTKTTTSKNDMGTQAHTHQPGCLSNANQKVEMAQKCIQCIRRAMRIVAHELLQCQCINVITHSAVQNIHTAASFLSGSELLPYRRHRCSHVRRNVIWQKIKIEESMHESRMIYLPGIEESHR